MVGKVPYVKQHVRWVHGEATYRSIDWPPTQLPQLGTIFAEVFIDPNAPKPLEKMTLNELRHLGSECGISVRWASRQEMIKLLQSR
jgi:hypothetical protein